MEQKDRSRLKEIYNNEQMIYNDMVPSVHRIILVIISECIGSSYRTTNPRYMEYDRTCDASKFHVYPAMQFPTC